MTHESASLVFSALLGGLMGALVALLIGAAYGVLRTVLNKNSRAHQKVVIAEIGWKGALRNVLFEEKV